MTIPELVGSIVLGVVVLFALNVWLILRYKRQWRS
jgi:uncharacterized membrane protein